MTPSQLWAFGWHMGFLWLQHAGAFLVATCRLLECGTQALEFRGSVVVV